MTKISDVKLRMFVRAFSILMPIVGILGFLLIKLILNGGG